jgi:hypothetical protein
VHDEPLDDTAGNDTLLGVEVCNLVSRTHSNAKCEAETYRRKARR